MTALYIALIQLLGSAIVSKIQADATNAANRQKIADAVEAQWQQVQAAHIEVQTGEKPDAKAP